MNEIPLAEFLEHRTQEQAARQIGITQSRVSQMVRANKQVFVLIAADGQVVDAYEKRPIGMTARPAAA